MSDHRIILSDCLGPEGLATLPNKSVDHVITDPPYEAEAHEKLCRANSRGPGHGKSAIVEIQHDFAAITEEQRHRAAKEITRIGRGWILIFCQIEAVGAWREALVAAGAAWRRGMVWLKIGAMPQVTGDRPGTGCECVALAWSGNGRSKWNGGGKAGVYECARESLVGVPYVHPTQKPLALMESLIRDFTDPGELICDPFAGSGTTGVAAKRLGRRFIGWERDPKYHAIAQKRIDGAREQLGLFRERQPKPKQEPLLGVDDHG